MNVTFNRKVKSAYYAKIKVNINTSSYNAGEESSDYSNVITFSFVIPAGFSGPISFPSPRTISEDYYSRTGEREFTPSFTPPTNIPNVGP